MKATLKVESFVAKMLMLFVVLALSITIEIRGNFLCGVPVCVCFSKEINCRNRHLRKIPIFEIRESVFIFTLILSRNNITEIDVNDLDYEKWMSLSTVDLRGNKHFNCKTLEYIRPNIEVYSDCYVNSISAGASTLPGRITRPGTSQSPAINTTGIPPMRSSALPTIESSAANSAERDFSTTPPDKSTNHPNGFTKVSVISTEKIVSDFEDIGLI